MNPLRIVSVLFVAALGAGAVALAACDTETASSVVVDNAYPKQTVVYRAWWVATYFPDPVAGGASSTVERAVPASDFAYAVLAPGWDPASPTAPAPGSLVIVKSLTRLAIDRGETLHITVSDQSFTGHCGANTPLAQDDADYIAQRIFPGEFGGLVYDAKTCTAKAADAGVVTDAASDAPDGG